MKKNLVRPLINSLYQSASEVKNMIYDWGLIKPVRLKIPVISVGNLSFGGSGKTPMIKWILRQLVDERNVAVVSKSYKSYLSTPEKVQLKKKMDPGFSVASYYGDEPCLIAQDFPKASVWSGPHKSETALECLKFEKPDCLLVDDGFSHRQLYRDLDIVLIDMSVIGEAWYREFWHNLKRAHIVVLTKIENIKTDEIETFRNELSNKFPHLSQSIFKARMKAVIQNQKSQKAFLVSGVAQNNQVKLTLDSLGMTCVDHKTYSDHHLYSDSDLNDIYNLWQRLKMNDDLQIVTTAKDYLKWAHLDWASQVAVLDYEWQIESEEQRQIYEKIKFLF